jgi:D-tyrosyl-tRNA(Tyr) deacylase
MRAVVQRVSGARVSVVVDGGGCAEVGSLPPGGPGLLVFLGVGRADGEGDLGWMVRKICGLRIFGDDQGQMNRSVVDVGGGLLVVSQFTLYGDCRKGRRPSFVGAMDPEEARGWIDRFVEEARKEVSCVETGRFGAHMVVDLQNDGPVTLWLDSADRSRKGG